MTDGINMTNLVNQGFTEPQSFNQFYPAMVISQAPCAGMPFIISATPSPILSAAGSPDSSPSSSPLYSASASPQSIAGSPLFVSGSPLLSNFCLTPGNLAMGQTPGFCNTFCPTPTYGPSQVQYNIPDLNLNSFVQQPAQQFQVEKEPDMSHFETFYSLPLIKHQATLGDISKYGTDIIGAMKLALRCQLDLYVVVVSDELNMELQWKAHRECDFDYLHTLTQAPNFKKKLICELALIGDGEFNKHIHGSKQNTIVNAGWMVFYRLAHALRTFNGAKDRLLTVAEENMFDDNNVDDLFGVCEAPRGRALRGETVVGAHFRGGDVLKMLSFLDEVEKITYIREATMIPSKKGRSQYKGWTLYIETGSLENVERIKEASKVCNFEKQKNARQKIVFTAIDNFKREE